MIQPQLKVTYFPVAGRAELTCLVLAFGGIQFEDDRIASADYPALKPTLPLTQLPVLEVNGTTFAQSMAMARYAGRLTGLYPPDPLEALKVDMVTETLFEGFNTYVDINWRTPDETVKAERIKTFVSVDLPKMFALFEQHVTGKFLLGNDASIADVLVFDLYLNAIKTVFSDFKVTPYPKVEAVLANVAANPGVVAYLATHSEWYQ